MEPGVPRPGEHQAEMQKPYFKYWEEWGGKYQWNVAALRDPKSAGKNLDFCRGEAGVTRLHRTASVSSFLMTDR